MDERRSFDEHVGLFAAYSNHVARLSAPAWERLRLRCAELDGPSFRALLGRAFLSARPYEVWLAESTRHLVAPRVIAGVSRVVQTSLALAGQFAMEFDGRGARLALPPSRRTVSTGERTTDTYIDATFVLESALAPIAREHPGVATAVRAAGQAVLRHDWLSRADFDAVYRFVEPDVPFAGLEPPRSGMSE